MPSALETATQSRHGAWIEIRLERMRRNLEALKSHAGKSAGVLAVVKANAYGHGLPEVARALSAHVRYLGVSTVEEALALKESGMETPLFLFGCLSPAEIPAVLMKGITLTVSSFEEAREISAATCALPAPERTTLHIKVDTGMGRLGIPGREAFETIQKIAALPAIDLEGIYTHFPTADREDGFAEKQLADFAALLMALQKKGIAFRLRHAANSAASLKWQTPILNLMRPGIALYGIYPDEGLRSSIELAPVLSLKSRILMTKRLAQGDSVGYGRDFIADRPTTIAVLPIGYSHGYPFRLSNKAWVLHRGRRFPLAGRVSMDYLCVNFGEHTPQIGEPVTLIGEEGDERIRAEDLSEWAGTIPYEIVTRLASRLTRIYYDS